MELLFLFVLIPLEMWLLFTVDQKKLSYGKRAIAALYTTKESADSKIYATS